MHKIIKTSLLTASLFISGLSHAATLDVTFELPTPTNGKGSSPYVAIWAEQKGQSKHLLVWHLQSRKDEWLPDLRRWWRKIGRYDNYSDGISGATRKPGIYQESLDVGDWEKFKLYVEVVRETGGRSLLKTTIDLSKSNDQYHLPADTEVGDISIKIKH